MSMHHPQSQFEHDEGKANAALCRGSGVWPLQQQPCELEPPYDDHVRAQLTEWDCYVNGWEGPFRVNVLGRLVPGEIVLPHGGEPAVLPAMYMSDHENLVPIRVEHFPEDEVTTEKAEQLLRALPNVQRPVSFEVIGRGPVAHEKASIDGRDPSISVQFVADRDDAAGLQRVLLAHYPNSSFLIESHLNEDDMEPANELYRHGDDWFGGTLTLRRSYCWSLRTISDVTADPLGIATAAMEDLGHDELAMVQVLFMPAWRDWAENVSVAVCDPYKPKEYLFSDLSDAVLGEKFSTPLFAVSVRILSNSTTAFDQLLGWAEQFAAPPQQLIWPDKDGAELGNAVGARCTYQPGLLLNVRELASLVHLPGSSITSERLRRAQSRTRRAPMTPADPHSVLLGFNRHQGQERKVTIPGRTRQLHTYVFGKTGTGKTTLLENMLRQDIHAGHGVGLIDPHGDLFDRILTYIPEHRIEDVVIFDPTDRRHPPAFNILQSDDVLERDRLTSETIRIIRRLVDGWGPQLDHFLRHGLLTMMQFKNATMETLQKIYLDDNERRTLVGMLNPDKHEQLIQFWNQEYANRSKMATQPLLNRLGKFLTNSVVYNIVCQKRSTFDFDKIINSRKIFLAKFPAGVLPEDAATLLGTCLVAKLISAAFRRIKDAEEDRPPFYLYLDEFQRFMGLASDFDTILSETRKYKLLAILAHQYTGQLKIPVRQAIFGNVGTMIMFQVGPQDTPTVKSELGEFTAQELQSLRLGHAIVKMSGADEAFNLQTHDRPEPEEPDHRDRIIKWSRTKYCGRPLQHRNRSRPPVDTPPRAAPPAKAAKRPQRKVDVTEEATSHQVVAVGAVETKPKKKPAASQQTAKREQPQQRLRGGHDDPADDFV